MPPCCKVRAEMALLGNRCAAPAAAGRLAATKVYTDVQSCLRMSAGTGMKVPFLFLFLGEESLHAHRCQSCQQPERLIKQTTGECRVHSTSYDKGSCFAMA